MHHVAAVGDATVITCHPMDIEGHRGEANVDRPATSSEILANAAPANAGDNRIRRGLVPNLSAQTAARNGHFFRPIISLREHYEVKQPGGGPNGWSP